MLRCMLCCLCFQLSASYRVWFVHLCPRAHQAQWKQWRSQGQVYLYCPRPLSQSLKQDQKGSEDKSSLLKNQIHGTLLINFTSSSQLSLPQWTHQSPVWDLSSGSHRLSLSLVGSWLVYQLQSTCLTFGKWATVNSFIHFLYPVIMFRITGADNSLAEGYINRQQTTHSYLWII